MLLLQNQGLLTPDGPQPLSTKFILVKKATDSEITPAIQVQYASPPSVCGSHQDDAIVRNFVNSRGEDNEVNPQIFGYGHFTFRHPKTMVQANTFWYQEIVSLHRRCFCQPETSCERTLTQVPSSLPQAPTIGYMSGAEAYSGNGTKHMLSLLAV